ncbi:MAG: HesA/MoeB/ThiF family protein [Planctomycetota bacterium]
MSRYDRQQKIHGGKPLDERWRKLRILLVGCGGVGTPLAQSLVRSGIGTLTILDGDRVRQTDLHRQTLYLEEDARLGVAKATAAGHALQLIGGRTRIETVPEMLTPANAVSLFQRHDIVLDATDHIPARLLIDKTALATGTGWIHAAAIADRWVAASFVPPGSPCYHCWVPESPTAGSIGTCETEGILPVACLAAATAVLRLLTSWLRSSAEPDATPGVDFENKRIIIRGSIDDGETTVQLPQDPHCWHCSENSEDSPQNTMPDRTHLRKLCGAGAVEAWLDLGLDEIDQRLQQLENKIEISRGSFSIRAADQSGSLICYHDGRALIVGNHGAELANARRLLENWLGEDALARF